MDFATSIKDAGILVYAIAYATVMYPIWFLFWALSFVSPKIAKRKAHMSQLGMDPKHVIWSAAADQHANVVIGFICVGLVGLVCVGIGIGYLIWG